MGKNYFLTGGGGLLGKFIVRLICEDNVGNVEKITVFDVRVNDKSRYDIEQWCKSAGIKCDIVIGDINDNNKLMSALPGCDVIIHSAAVIDYDGYTDEKLINKVNVGGTATILKAAIATGVDTFVYTSSITAVFPNKECHSFYGDEDTPYTGTPILPYGRSKQAAEKLVLSKNGEPLSTGGKLFRTVSLRLPMIYGPGDQVLKQNIDAFIAAKTIASFLPQKVDQLYVGNAAWAHVLAAQKLNKSKDLGGKAYYITDDTPRGPYYATMGAFLKHEGFKVHPRVPYIPSLIWMSILYVCITLSWLLSLVGLKRKFLITPDLQRMSEVEFEINGSKFRRDFDYAPKFTWAEACTKAQQWASSYIKTKYKAA